MRQDKMIKKYWVAGLLMVGVLTGLVLGVKQMGRNRGLAEVSKVNPKTGQQILTVGGVGLMVEVRDDDEGRALGLSGRESLGKNEGMLFLFEQPLKPTFWMKGMKFDLDMIWIASGMVVEVSEMVPAPTGERSVIETVTPSQSIDMVLEVESGWVEREGIEIGDKVDF